MFYTFLLNAIFSPFFPNLEGKKKNSGPGGKLYTLHFLSSPHLLQQNNRKSHLTSLFLPPIFHPPTFHPAKHSDFKVNHPNTCKQEEKNIKKTAKALIARNK